MAELANLTNETAFLAEAIASYRARQRSMVKGKLSTRRNLETGPSTPAQQMWRVRRNTAGDPNSQGTAAHNDYLEDIASAISQGQSALCVHPRRLLATKMQCQSTSVAWE